MDGSIVLISLPAIFRGIHLDPLTPGNVSYLLWTLMGFLVVTAVLVVTLGRLGDMYGRVRIYNLGFVNQQDLPYPEIVNHARSVAQRIYQVHAGQLPPSEQRASVR